jgi:hypothetical protein
MTTSVTDDRQAFEAWAVANGHPVTVRYDGSDKYVSTLTNLRWHGWQAALRSQGKVAEVSRLRALAGSWQRKADNLGFPYGEDYLGCANDLTAIIGEGD